MLARYHRKRKEAIDFLGGKCLKCETTEDLEFDHIDPKTKTIDICKAWSYKTEIFWNEVKKCQLLCKLHHKNKSGEEASVAHGGGLTGKRNCYCELCKPLKQKYNKELRFLWK